MKISELIEILKKENQDRDVLLSSDPEGNTISPIDISYGTGCYSINEFSGEVNTGPEELTEELKNKGFTEEDILDNGIPCIILYPK